MNNNTYLSRLICDSCHVQRMARIWLMLRTQYNITRIWLLRTHKQTYSFMIHITFPAWLIKISFHVHSMTHMWLISRSSMTHKDLMPCSQYDSYVTHITCTSWLVYDSCLVHSITNIWLTSRALHDSYMIPHHVHFMTHIWFMPCSQYDSYTCLMSLGEGTTKVCVF